MKDSEFSFSDKEIALYFYLLKTCNSQGWNNPFKLSNAITSAKFGWGRYTFNDVKNKLKQADLIDFKAGNGRGNTYKYEILSSKSPARNPNRMNHLSLPYNTVRFESIWNKLRQTPKWIKKSTGALQATLDKLSEYEEDFAILLIEQCIIGDWQGIIFNDTNTQYNKWKAERNKTNGSEAGNTANQRKAEIMHRANIAAITCNS